MQRTVKLWWGGRGNAIYTRSSNYDILTCLPTKKKIVNYKSYITSSTSYGKLKVYISWAGANDDRYRSGNIHFALPMKTGEIKLMKLKAKID